MRCLFLALLCLAGCVHRPANLNVVWSARAVRTQDPRAPVVEAVVVKEGKIAFAGSRAAALEFAGDGAAVEDFPEATIVPGLVDAHAHLLSLGRSLSVVRLNAARSEEEALTLAVLAPTSAFQGDWMVGRGWDQNDWKVQQFPGRKALDAKFPATPVFLSRIDGHAAWVNGEALRRAGITRDTRDPEGGRIHRDAAGEPTGVLIDNAVDLVAAKIPAATEDQRRERLKRGLERCAAVGLTGIHDAGLDLAAFTQLQQWDSIGALPVRVYAMADGQGADAATFIERGPFEGRHLKLKAVKFVADGALGSRGAALHQPYSDEPTQAGLLLLPPEELASRAKAFADRGFQVAVHAIGDRAINVALEVLTGLEKTRPGSRHRVEHVQVLADADLPRFAAAGIVASMQPTHATSDMPWAAKRVGEERLKLAYAWRAILDSGAHLAFGSDFPVEEPEPLAGLYAARTRQDAQGKPEGGWHPEQLVTGDEALAAFTTGSAYAEFAEERRGRLSVGMDADFVVLSVDPVAAPPKELLTGWVLVTVVDGRDVYRRP